MNPFEQMLHKLSQIQKNDSDYDVDGITYCGKCKTPKSGYIDVALPESKTNLHTLVPIPCACEQERLKQEEEDLKRNQQNSRARQNRLQAFLGNRYTNHTFAKNTKPNDKNIARAMVYVNNFPEMLKTNSGFFFYGNPGTGKTFIAGCIVNALLDQGYSVIATDMATMLTAMQNKDFDNSQFLHKVETCDLLVLDDFGAERQTDWTLEQVFAVTNRRYNSRKPLIITSNLDYSVLTNPNADMMLKRIYDRIKDRCAPVLVNGKNMRDANARENIEHLRELFDENEQPPVIPV